jgi:hypothetical protein
LSRFVATDCGVLQQSGHLQTLMAAIETRRQTVDKKMIPRGYATSTSPSRRQGQDESSPQGPSLNYNTASAPQQVWSSQPQPHPQPQMHSSSETLHHDNSLYQENQAYAYSPQHWHQQELSQMQSQPPRSSPIAIKRAPIVGEHPTPEHSDDEEETSVVDVQRDAIKLREKYGDKVVASTYTQSSSSSSLLVGGGVSGSVCDSLLSNRMLKAPYLGSLSRSANFLVNMPPINLSEFQDDEDDGIEPPPEICSYGSLRESHQRGIFLDGPSSYREPRSGSIKRLDHRVRYQKSGTPAVSIGERMQKALKLKEVRKKEKTKGEEKEAATSSLSAMMSEVSQKPGNANGSTVASNSTSTPSATLHPPATGLGFLLEPVTFAEAETQAKDRYDPPNMMSSSLTAFEVLMSSNQVTKSANECSRSYAARPPTSLLPPSAQSEFREWKFQPLARSMSDPTPHLLHGRSLSTSLGLDPSAAAFALNPTTTQQQQKPLRSTVNGWAVPSSGIYQFPTPDHNPDTDAAFDMDMD